MAATNHHLPDPLGMLARIKSKMNPQCAVRRSTYCDYIISMSMQAVPYRDIEAWLIEQGPQYRIAASTICKNLKTSKLDVRLTHAEEKLEKLGGFINLNHVRELSQLIITQKGRVDHLVRLEEEKRKDPALKHYSDKRIAQEMDLMAGMIKSLNSILALTKDDAAKRLEESMKAMDDQGLKMTADGKTMLTDLLLHGDLVVTSDDLAGIPTSSTEH